MATKEVKERSKEITELFNSYETYPHFKGTEQLVWISGMEEKKKDQIMGHTKNYSKVIIREIEEGRKPEELIGKLVRVKVVATQKWHIEGEIIDYAPKAIQAGEDYFTKIDAERKINKEKKQRKRQQIALTRDSQNLGAHLLGMLMISIGIFMVLRSIG